MAGKWARQFGGEGERPNDADNRWGRGSSAWGEGRNDGRGGMVEKGLVDGEWNGRMRRGLPRGRRRRCSVVGEIGRQGLDQLTRLSRFAFAFKDLEASLASPRLCAGAPRHAVIRPPSTEMRSLHAAWRQVPRRAGGQLVVAASPPTLQGGPTRTATLEQPRYDHPSWP